MTDVLPALRERFPGLPLQTQETTDPWPTIWVDRDHVTDVLAFLGQDLPRPFSMLYDLTAIDERERKNRRDQPESDFTVVYHLLSLDRNADVRVKVPLRGDRPSTPTVSGLWPNADWYEREVWDMFGVRFDDHPRLRRILMPPGWEGHPLRKEHPARATELGRYELTPEREDAELEALRFHPEAWGLERKHDDTEFLFLNLGPQHPGTHGVLRIILQLDGEEIVDAVPDIGYHHRGAEKMGERQTWHTYIPYTDRVDYMSGVVNELAYVLSVEQLAGIRVPDRVKVIRVMMCELFRIISHLVWYGTFAQDVGQFSPVFYTFTDRERAFDIVEAVCGGRMHPNWFRIGGVGHDLPEGWEAMFRDFLDYLPKRLREYDRMIMQNPLIKARTVGIGHCTREQAIAWGATGPMLRATGLEWDFRKKRPYSGYEWFEFDIPTAEGSDCYARAEVRVEEMRQSLRIIQQCVDHMPEGSHRSFDGLATPPRKDPGTMQDIETLIHHFLSVSWGPVVPPGEACPITEGAKGAYSYYLISDGESRSYRTRIRSPSFPHMQFVPEITRGAMVQDLVAVLGALDFVLADVDR